MTPQACIKAQEYVSVQAAEFQMLGIVKLYCTVVVPEEMRVSNVEAAGLNSMWPGSCGCRKLHVCNAIVIVWQIIFSGLSASLSCCFFFFGV